MPNKIQEYLPRPTGKKVAPPKPTFITPALNPQAVMDIQAWTKGGRAAFVRPVQQPLNPGNCANCCDFKHIWVSFCERGFSQTPYSDLRNPSLYFEGNHIHPKGWYKIRNEGTVGYPCPLCNKDDLA